MTTGQKLWIGTSWKMNKLRADAIEFATTLKASTVINNQSVQPFVVPPFPYIAEVADILGSTPVMVGAQSMHWDDQGPWTGEVSAPMIRDCGASLVELGHSERRTFFNETDDTVALKVKAALDHGLTALVCLGDTREEYDKGNSTEVLKSQTRAALSLVGEAAGNVIFAYEPVWSIGEGGTPADPAFVNEQHQHIKAIASADTGADVPVLYGGSVNQSNCCNFIQQSQVDGLFIGRAAWDVSGYIKILELVIDELEL